ncbi:MAG TPA: hypothetical protein VFW92_05795 [Candidatus Limnocylindrales bacterium]|nr:hypothetical protein [Candidatus Limnocylindrales bacterium]
MLDAEVEPIDDGTALVPLRQPQQLDGRRASGSSGASGSGPSG